MELVAITCRFHQPAGISVKALLANPHVSCHRSAVPSTPCATFTRNCTLLVGNVPHSDTASKYKTLPLLSTRCKVKPADCTGDTDLSDFEEHSSPQNTRRHVLVGTAGFLTVAAGGQPSLAEELQAVTESGKAEQTVPREASTLPTSSSPSPSTTSSETTSQKSLSNDATITGKVYLDFSLCPTAARPDRTLGNTSLICSDGERLGRVVIGLYGKQVPKTVENFVAMVTGKAGATYKGSIIHRILPGQFIQGGRQGSRDRGEVDLPTKLERNPETISGAAFKLQHSRPGTVSLCLGENDDDNDVKSYTDYRNVQFLITTGPGPAPQLDNSNIVLGTVLEGMDVITRIGAVPTYRPAERIKQFNGIAQFFGDERAANARSTWDRPLKSIVISDCGVL